MRSKDKKVTWFDSLSDEQKYKVNLYIYENINQEKYKEVKPIDIDINVIATYENEPQEIFDVTIEQLHPNQICSITTEHRILGSIIKNLKEESDRDLDYLVKISLGYMDFYVDGELQSFKDSDSRDEFLKSINLLETIDRCNSKYYFQPNQRDIVSNYLVDLFDVSRLTSDYDPTPMVTSPYYIEGKKLVEEGGFELVDTQIKKNKELLV